MGRAELAVAVDVVHAATMAAWLVGMPLLVVRRWPRLSRAYALYALGFVVLSQLSHWAMGGCFLTAISRALWESQPRDTVPADASEWFSVRLARAVFHAAPSHRVVVWVSEALVLVTALGAHRSRGQRRRRARH